MFSLRTIFVGVPFAPTIFRAVSALSTVPTFNRILVLVLALVLVLSVLSLLSLLAFAFALASAKCATMGSSPPGCDEPSCLTFRAFA